MRGVGWLQVVVGLAVAGLWAMLLATGQVPEVQQGRADIWFHIAAEVGMAVLLLTAGAAALRGARRAPLLSALALGMLAYSAVNSAGYYAESDEWIAVAGFGLVLAGATAAFAALRHGTGEAAVDAAAGEAEAALPVTGGSSAPPMR